MTTPGGNERPDDDARDDMRGDEPAISESFPTIDEALAAAEDEADPELAERLAEARAEDDEREADLQVVLRSGLFGGPDDDVVREVAGEAGRDADFDDDYDELFVSDDERIDPDDAHRPDDDPHAPYAGTDDAGAGDPTGDPASSENPTGEGTPEEEAALAELAAQIVARAPEHAPQPSLERVREALDLLGNPQDSYPVIHLTGTNGKSSTARMIEALLRERGLRTGRFTSPHLHSVRERIALDGAPISTPDFLTAYHDVAPYLDLIDERNVADGGARLSFFELLTVLGYAAFADTPVDVAVVEVGLGGRWDATNVARGQVAVLTTIERDHMRWLGSTLTDIANEKVGIIEEGATVVVARQHEEVEGIVLSAAATAGARLVREDVELEVVDRETAVGGQVLTLSTPAGVYEGIFLPLHGAHQARNALLALAAVEQFFGGAALAGDVVEQAFAGVTSPGRLEVVRASPLVIVDAAHNPAGIEALREGLAEAFDLEHVVGVVGVMYDKEAEAMLGELEPLLEEVVITDAGTDRAMPAEELAEIAREVFGEERVHLVPRLDEAIDRAATLAEADQSELVTRTAVLVVGSVVLAGRAREVTGHTRG
ncbi:bifunctional folylpolyglutamate synthase/dihydrofolate synthase [Georgenia sp. Z1491]|uniref:bifunctional folylpolyglutamate synthase/dihydrofolate synthase n=1 Tax=Georgenia sp. Z1491 TaxID=3416707 RepID=UPI003CF95F06